MKKLQSILNEHFESRIRSRGYQYFTSRKVTDLEISGKFVSAFVNGSEEYIVEIEFDDDLDPVYMECDCPYNEEDNCKHLVALLYELEKEDFFAEWDGNGRNTNKKNAKIINLPVQNTTPKVLSVEEQERNARNNFLLFKDKIHGLIPKPEAAPSKTKYKLAFGLIVNHAGTSSALHILRQRLLKDGSVADTSFAYDVNFDTVEPLSIEERLVASYLMRSLNQSHYFGFSYSQNEKRLKQSNNDVLNILAGKEIYFSARVILFKVKKYL